MMSDNPQENLPHVLQARFETLKEAFQRLDAAADDQIVRWRYVEQSGFQLRAAIELRADFFRRYHTTPGTLVDEEPLDAFTYLAYGYDKQERIIYAAHFGMDELPLAHTFYLYQEGMTEAVVYKRMSQKYRLIEVSRVVMEPPDEVPTHFCVYHNDSGHGQCTFESYHYDERGRMSLISTIYSFHPPFLGDEDEAANASRHEFKFITSGTAEHHYEYDGDVFKRIVSHKSFIDSWDDAEDINQPRSPYETDESLSESARVSLRDTLIKHVSLFDAEDRQQGQVYCLSISYDAVSAEGLMLSLGTEAERKAWEKEAKWADEYNYMMLHAYDSDLIVSVWELPADYRRFVADYRRDQRWDEIRAFHIQVASDLNDHNWENILNTTEDFIVFAYDSEANEDVNEVIRECVPEDKVRMLEAKGLLD